jgi:hypothetical protein
MSEQLADDVIRIVDFKENIYNTHSFDSISKTSIEDGIVINFTFDDSDAEYEVVIIEDEIQEAIYYSESGETTSKVNPSIDEAVEFLYA